jgi:hypothetical protein
MDGWNPLSEVSVTRMMLRGKGEVKVRAVVAGDGGSSVFEHPIPGSKWTYIAPGGGYVRAGDWDYTAVAKKNEENQKTQNRAEMTILDVHVAHPYFLVGDHPDVYVNSLGSEAPDSAAAKANVGYERGQCLITRGRGLFDPGKMVILGAPTGEALRLVRPVDPADQLIGGDAEEGAAIDLHETLAGGLPPSESPLASVGRAELLDSVRGIDGEFLPGFVVGGHNLDDDRRGRHIHPRRQGTVIAAVGHPVIVRFPEVERTGTDQSGLLGVRTQKLGQHVVEVTMPGVRRRSHVVLALPDLVEAIESEPVPPPEELFQLRRTLSEQDRLHGIKGIGAAGRCCR